MNPFKYPEPKVEHNKTVPKSASASFILEKNADSPNVTLSRFFAEKGDGPLSNVEIEGVLSLIGKSFQGSGNDSMVGTTETFSPAPLQVKKQRQARPIRSSNTSFSNSPVASYKPTYSNSPEPSPHQRVVEYSSIPSQYKTRIRKPLLSVSSSTPHKVSSSSTSILSESSVPAEPLNNKKLSNTANALLSLLDGEATETANALAQKSILKNFANPYAASPSSSFLLSSKKRLQKQREQRLQQQEKAVFNSPTPAVNSVSQSVPFSFGLSEKQAVERDDVMTYGFSNDVQDAQAAISGATSVEEGEDDDDDDDEVQEEQYDEEQSDYDEEEEEAEQSDYDEEEEEEEEDQNEGEVVEISDDESEEEAAKFAPIQQPVSAPAVSTSIPVSSIANGLDFDFPSIEPPAVPAEVDDTKTEQFKALFEF